MVPAFMLVPTGSRLLLGEKFEVKYVLGVLLIFCGIVMAVKL